MKNYFLNRNIKFEKNSNMFDKFYKQVKKNLKQILT